MQTDIIKYILKNIIMKTIVTVQSFTQINISDNYLVVLDLDETIIKYEGICKQWWKDKFEHYYKIHKDYDLVDSLSSRDWKEHMKITLPSHTDKNGFYDLIERSKNMNCKIIIVTARDEGIKDITYKHLKYLNVTNIDVYFVSGGNKAKLIDKVINDNSEKYDNIVFVDDMDFNLKDVKEHFGDKVLCYKFDYQC